MYKLYLSVGIFYIVYRYRIPIILNINFWYRKLFKKISNRKMITNKKITKIKNSSESDELTMYEYRFDNNDYVTFDKSTLDIDLVKYNEFRRKLTKNSPNDIINAEFSYVSVNTDSKKIVDVIDDVRKLFGPFLIESSHQSIIDYFTYKIFDIKDIISLYIMYSDGEEKIYDFLSKNDSQNISENEQTIYI